MSKKIKVIKIIIILVGVFVLASPIIAKVINEIYNNEILHSYTGTEDIDIDTVSENTVARITISDTYTKSGTKYIIFTTNKSGGRKFEMNENDYDKYIGLGNDAVDCSIYTLTCKSDIYSYSYLGLFTPDYDLYDADSLEKPLSELKENIDITTLSETLETFGVIMEDNFVHVKSAYTIDYSQDDYKIYVKENKDEKTVNVYSELTVERYSFAGESDFTEKEQKIYVENIDKLNSTLVRICGELVHE